MASLQSTVNSLRMLRIQLKSGYIKRPPPEYLFLQRYPPVFRTSKPSVEKFIDEKSSIGELYEKAIGRNAVYADERVYPAYWQQEPTALTLAKRQYQLMKNGLDEETAYVNAMRYVEELESKSYENSKNLEKLLKEKGANVVYAADESLMQDITFWRARLADTRYSNMTLGDQGQIDYLIQTRVLKWEEVERERRMTDPIFYQQFINVRSAIFPEIATERELKHLEQLEKSRQHFKNDLYKKYQVNETQLSPSSPFYLEDYQFYFEKVAANPNLTTWSESDRSTFFRWIVNTLALREVLKNSASVRVQSYLEDLRNKFFPMIKYPERTYTLPDIQGLKMVLYKNEIGYKKQRDKLYVRRFYRLPALLFPEETAEPVPSYRISQHTPSAGLSASARNKSVREIRKELESKSAGMSNKKLTLDDLLRDDEESSDEETVSAATPSSTPPSSQVEELLKSLDLSSEEDTGLTSESSLAADNDGTVDSSASFTAENKIPIQLSKQQIELFTATATEGGDTDLKLLLDHFQIAELPKDQQLRQDCRDILANLSKDTQREVFYRLLGSQPLVEEVRPEDYYPFLLEKISGKKLEECYELLKDVNILGRISTSEERKLLIEKYDPTEKTMLEIEREEYLQQLTRTSYDYCVTETDYDQVYTARQQFLIMEKAQMAVQYEQREAARRVLDWQERGVIPPEEKRKSRGITLYSNQMKISTK